MDVDVSSGPSGGYPRRSGRTRSILGRRCPRDNRTEPSIHPFVGSDPSSPKPLDATRLGLDRLRIILSGDDGEEISSFSLQKRIDFVIPIPSPRHCRRWRQAQGGRREGRRRSQCAWGVMIRLGGVSSSPGASTLPCPSLQLWREVAGEEGQDHCGRI